MVQLTNKTRIPVCYTHYLQVHNAHVPVNICSDKQIFSHLNILVVVDDIVEVPVEEGVGGQYGGQLGRLARRAPPRVRGLLVR